MDISVVMTSASLGAFGVLSTGDSTTVTTILMYCQEAVAGYYMSLRGSILAGNYYKVTQANSPTLTLWVEEKYTLA
jgi:hypothetical protein